MAAAELTHCSEKYFVDRISSGKPRGLALMQLSNSVRFTGSCEVCGYSTQILNNWGTDDWETDNVVCVLPVSRMLTGVAENRE